VSTANGKAGKRSLIFSIRYIRNFEFGFVFKTDSLILPVMFYGNEVCSLSGFPDLLVVHVRFRQRQLCYYYNRFGWTWVFLHLCYVYM